MRCYPYFTDFISSVPFIRCFEIVEHTGWLLFRQEARKEPLHIRIQMLLIAFAREYIISLSRDNLVRNRSLTAKCIERHETPFDVEYIQQERNSRNLIRFLV